MMVPVLKSVDTIQGWIVTKRAASTAAKMASAAASAIETAAEKAATDATKNAAFWTALLEEAKEELTEEQYNAALAAIAEGKALDENTKATLKNVAAKKLAKQGKGGGLDIGGTEARMPNKLPKGEGGGGLKNLFGKGKSFITKNAGMLIKLGGVALIAGGVIAAWKITENLLNKEENAAKEAAKKAEEAKSRLEAAKTEYNDVLSKIDSYESGRKALDDMIEGTTEWRVQV
jgi:hypothetical protein